MSRQPPHFCATIASRPEAAFTLVELMVVLVVLAMLAALTLTGLSGARDRAKADKTRSTIRKLHEIVVPHYESYLSRRVSLRPRNGVSRWDAGSKRFVVQPSGVVVSSTSAAATRLWGLRVLMTLEIPDQWADVGPSEVVPTWAVTAPVKRYAVKKVALSPTPAYESAECLALAVMRGGFDTDLIETFRADEIGDVDGDRHPEFLDGWGKPIGFIRWPVGYQSPLFPRDTSLDPDPFDPMRASAAVPYPTVPSQTDYRTLPLIFSAGGDAALDLAATGPTPNYGGYVGTADVMGSTSWLSQLGLTTSGNSVVPSPVPSNRSKLANGLAPGEAANPAATRDNITNYDMLKK